MVEESVVGVQRDAWIPEMQPWFLPLERGKGTLSCFVLLVSSSRGSVHSKSPDTGTGFPAVWFHRLKYGLFLCSAGTGGSSNHTMTKQDDPFIMKAG